jgi:archaellum component FlaC
MATVRTQRSAPPYALIVFVFLFVVTAIVAIMLYLKLGKAEQTASTDNQNLALIASTADQNVPVVADLKANASPGNTVVHQLLSQIDQLESQISGNSGVAVSKLIGPSGPVNMVLAKAGMSGKSLVLALSQVDTQLVNARTQIQQMRTHMTNYQRRFASTRSSFRDDIHAINDKLNSAQKRIDDLTTKLNAANSQVSSEAGTLQQQITAEQTKYISELRGQVVQIQQLKQELQARLAVVQDLRNQIAAYRAPNTGANAILSQADGKVVRVSPSTQHVYINLGSAEHVTVGLSFAVYNPNLGVNTGENGGGAGSIAVIHVGKYASVCRITHLQSGEQIFAGDLIANPVFHKDQNRKFHFVIYGDFDVNGNGVATAAGRRQIVRLVESWGGVVDNHLTTQTDFLVLGSRPSNSLLNFNVNTQQTAALQAQRVVQQNRYAHLEQKAQNLSVPILNANRFLAMIGYYAHPLVQQ